jgi:hypothetical protein
MRATLLLADWAEAINGKLYIQGGGWTHVNTAAGPLNIAVAAVVYIGWDEANEKHKITFRLVDADGQVVIDPSDDKPVVLETVLEMGRPPGLAKGSELAAPIAIGMSGLILSPGRYRYIVERDDEPLESVSFDAV